MKRTAFALAISMAMALPAHAASASQEMADIKTTVVEHTTRKITVEGRALIPRNQYTPSLAESMSVQLLAMLRKKAIEQIHKKNFYVEGTTKTSNGFDAPEIQEDVKARTTSLLFMSSSKVERKKTKKGVELIAVATFEVDNDPTNEIATLRSRLARAERSLKHDRKKQVREYQKLQKKVLELEKRLVATGSVMPGELAALKQELMQKAGERDKDGGRIVFNGSIKELTSPDTESKDYKKVLPLKGFVERWENFWAKTEETAVIDDILFSGEPKYAWEGYEMKVSVRFPNLPGRFREFMEKEFGLEPNKYREIWVDGSSTDFGKPWPSRNSGYCLRILPAKSKYTFKKFSLIQKNPVYLNVFWGTRKFSEYTKEYRVIYDDILKDFPMSYKSVRPRGDTDELIKRLRALYPEYGGTKYVGYNFLRGSIRAFKDGYNPGADIYLCIPIKYEKFAGSYRDDDDVKDGYVYFYPRRSKPWNTSNINIKLSVDVDSRGW